MIDRILKLLSYFARYIYSASIAKDDKYMDVLYEAVKNLGGVYVKLVQFVCLRTDVFPNEHKINFLSFYDAVPFEELDVRHTLRNELGEKKLDYFLSIDSEPFASGTFGQVYKGQFTDGTKIVVKVKRANLLLKLRVDFLVLKLLSKLFNFIYYQKIIDVTRLINEFEEQTYRELDYITEVQNAQYFYELYKNHSSIYVPKTFEPLSTANIIVQEYVEGIALTQLIRMRNRQQGDRVDTKFILTNLAYEVGLQALSKDKFYADPHPGNIIVLPNNKYALIDFGIIGKSPTNKRNYYDILKLLVSPVDDLDLEKLGKEFLEWGASHFYKTINVLDDYFATSEAKLSQVVTKKYRQLLELKKNMFRDIEVYHQENFSKMYLEIIKAGQDLNVRVPDGMLASLRTTAVLKSLLECLEPKLRPMRDVYKQLLKDVDYRTLVDTTDSRETTVSVEEAVESVLDWVGVIAESDLPLYRKLSRELKEVSYV